MLHYNRFGTGNQKILFIHGNLASARWWGPVMERMDSFYDMVAVDLPGYGESAPAADDVTIASHATNLIGLLGTLDFTPCIVVGHSLGGAVAMQLAADVPDLMDALVLVDSAPVTGMGPFDYDVLEQVVANEPLLQTSLKATLALDIPVSLMDMIMADCLTAKKSFIPNSRALTGIDFTKVAAVFEKPVLVLQGEKDPVISPEVAAHTAAAYPHNQLIVLPQSGHNPQIEVPDLFVQVLRDFIVEITQKSM